MPARPCRSGNRNRRRPLRRQAAEPAHRGRIPRARAPPAPPRSSARSSRRCQAAPAPRPWSRRASGERSYRRQKKVARVGLERQHRAGPAERGSDDERAPQDTDMAAMHAVEIADCHHGPRKPRRRRLRINNYDKFFCRQGFDQVGHRKMERIAGPESRTAGTSPCRGNVKRAPVAPREQKESGSRPANGMPPFLAPHINRIASGTTFNPLDAMTRLRQAPAP